MNTPRYHSLSLSPKGQGSKTLEHHQARRRTHGRVVHDCLARGQRHAPCQRFGARAGRAGGRRNGLCAECGGAGAEDERNRDHRRAGAQHHEPVFRRAHARHRRLLRAHRPRGVSLQLRRRPVAPKRATCRRCSSAVSMACCRPPRRAMRRHWRSGSRTRTTVVVDRPIAGLAADLVRVDHEAGARLAVEYMLSLGHRAIACLSGPSEFAVSRARTAGWCTAR